MKQHKKLHSGFTLLELLLVVVILSAMAFMVMGTTGDQISQVRYEDTRNRLEAIRTAILGPSGKAVWEHGIQSGFVVDNGVLPPNINLLVTNPVDGNDILIYHPFGPYTPIFDPTPGPDGFSNDSGDEKPLQELEHLLMKGHRGSYLPSSNEGKYRDGWGTRAEDSDDDDKNHGWFVDTTHEDGDVNNPVEGLSIKSRGMDGADERDDNYYEQDMEMTPKIVLDDWSVDVSGASVRVINRTGKDIALNSPASFAAALLVYENDMDGNTSWRTIKTGSVAVGKLDNGDGKDGSSTAWSEQQDFKIYFDDDNRVPIGEHLLVLASSNTPDLSDIANWPSSAKYVTAKVKFFPRGGVPEMVLEIR